MISLKRLFIVLSTIITILAFGFAFLANYFTARQYEQKIITQLQRQAFQLEDRLVKTFKFTEQQAYYIGELIADHGRNPKHIETILENFHSTPKDVIPWTTFIWANEEHQVLATNNFGLVQKNTSLAHRDYIHRAVEEPHLLKIGKPVFGVTSREYAIPAGLGIAAEGGRYIGTLVTGINIDKLTKEFEHIIGKGMSYALLDLDRNTVLESKNYFDTVVNNHTQGLITTVKMEAPSGMIFADKGWLKGGKGYSFFRKLETLPYIVIVSYDKRLTDFELWQSQRIKLLIAALFIFTVIGILSLIYYFAIMPVMKLSDSAQGLAHGYMGTAIPRQKTQEINILAHQLVSLKRYVNRLKCAEAKLIKANEEAQAASQLKARFVSNISHELRTPLNIIIGYTDVMKNKILGPINDKYTDYIDQVNRSGNQLLTLINNIIEITKTDKRTVELQEVPCNLYNMIEEVMDYVRIEAQEKNITMTNNIPRDLPALKADKARIRQVMISLFENAIKFGNKEGYIWAFAEANDKEMVLRIRDDGIGIEPEQIQHLTKSFYQVDSSLTRQAEGAGLGLWTVKNNIDLHGGELDIDSELGNGTTVTIRFGKERVCSTQGQN